MITNKNNTISDELKEEIYRVSSKLVDAQSDINDTYKYLLKRLLMILINICSKDYWD